jgi:predicted dehydrogenase
MFDDADLDAVMVATPDHHHVLAGILACQAGIDLYVEKALSVTIAEGRKLVEAVKRYGRVCQVGSQNRSMETNQYGCQLIRTGGIGKVSLVEVQNYRGPLQYDGLPAEPAPEGADWDLFCGPTPARPYNWRLWLKDERMWEKRKWRGWDMWRSYSGHLMTNWGAHSIDMVQCALGTDTGGPVKIWPMLEGHKGERRTCPVGVKYADGRELHFVLKVADKWTFHGTKGKAMMRRNEFFTDPPELTVDPPDFEEQNRIWHGFSVVVRPHIQNWLDCVKSRDEPNAPVEIGHRSVTICHLANIARELGRELHWDPDKEVFPGDEEANGLLDRPRRPGWELPRIR